MRFRQATAADAAAVARLVTEGFEQFRSFAPPGWKPPPPDEEREITERLLPDARNWTLVAEEDGALAGQVSFIPATLASVPVEDPGLAHLRNLFVVQAQWGSGLARALLSAAVGEATARGFTTFRLFTPAAHARARRFYEREGWRPTGEPFRGPALGLDLVQFRRPLAQP